MKITLQARTRQIHDLIVSCAERQITYEECCTAIAKLGFKTTSVYEMVRIAEDEIKANEEREQNREQHCITEFIDYGIFRDGR